MELREYLEHLNRGEVVVSGSDVQQMMDYSVGNGIYPQMI
jgi:hypothetical protein